MKSKRAPLALLAVALAASGCNVHVRSGDDEDLFLGKVKRVARDDHFDLDVKAGDTLVLTSPDGNVKVDVSHGAASKLDAHWSAYGRDESEANDVLARFKIEVAREGHRVDARVTGEPLELGSSGMYLSLSPDVNVEIALPEEVALELTTSLGNVTVRGPAASVTATNSYGDVTIEGARGALHLITTSGAITLENVRGAVDATSSYGDVKVKDVEGDSLRALTTSGSVKIAHATAQRIEARTSYDDVEIDDASGELDVSTTSGSIDVDRFTGSVHARTNYADVHLIGAFTSVDAESVSGAIEVTTAEPTAAGAWRLSSTYGHVTLTAPADFGAHLHATTIYGDIECALPFTANEGQPARKKEWIGALGGGGPKLLLETTNGDIRIQRGDG